ncbi:MAG TPA: DUF4349 domain-containing protein [Candidatus Acidoferrales bacterium]|nr:DUF4349 domain-containing protein [Candidatus Acidoferrales bacterium]
MNRATQHAFEPEEVMAYLDGELEPRRAAALAAHLERCDECRGIAAQFRQVSERLLDFAVATRSPNFDQAVLQAAARVKDEPPDDAKAGGRWFAAFGPWAWVGAVAVIVVIGVIVFVGIPLVQPRFMTAVSHDATTPMAYLPANSLSAQAGFEQKAQGGVIGKLEAPQPSGPMIAQTASLTIVANNYDDASAALGRLTASEGGYVQKLTSNARTGESRTVSATLRVPAKQLDGFLAELRKLGRVEQESQANDEVTDQYVDLQARLKSARASEQRMLQLLQTRTGKLEDVLDAERELARIRGEIESMEGQRVLLAHRVDYATVEVQLREEYREQLGAGRSSAITQIRNAAVDGFGNLEDGVIGVLLFLLDYGLSILFWSGIVGIPAWFAWRQFRLRRTSGK